VRSKTLKKKHETISNAQLHSAREVVMGKSKTRNYIWQLR